MTKTTKTIIAILAAAALFAAAMGAGNAMMGGADSAPTNIYKPQQKLF